MINENEKKDFVESLKEAIYNIIQNTNPLYYHDYNFDNYLKNECYLHYESFMNEELYNEIYDKYIETIFLELNMIKRSYLCSDERFDHKNNHKEQITYLKNVPQPAQKTNEWYEFRKNHLTGSNIWKAFSSESCKNQLLHEKLVPPMEQKISNSGLSEGPLNWGHKYEPLSILFYEYYNDVKVEEFGCIPHKTVDFLAASPDGIVTSEKNNGRMVEIKNVVSREITKIPKMEYYCQMQLQMEVCDLPDCDFVETKFVEYENEEEFKKDKYNIKKGMIIVLVKNNESYIYEYSPLFQNSENQLNKFSETIYKKYDLNDTTLEKDNIKWFRNIYWKLEIYSCVYVPRNKKWFEEAYITLKQLWDLIISERSVEDSYLKYKPKTRKNSKDTKELNELDTKNNNKIIHL